jgi:hypothetical protein
MDAELMRSRGFITRATRWGVWLCALLALWLVCLLLGAGAPDLERADEVVPSRQPGSPNCLGFGTFHELAPELERPLFDYRKSAPRRQAAGIEKVAPEPAPNQVVEAKVDTPPEPPPPPPKAPAPSVEGLILVATAALADGRGYALVRDGGSEKIVSVGEALRGGTVARVEPTALVLSRDGQEVSLKLVSRIPPVVSLPLPQLLSPAVAGKSLPVPAVQQAQSPREVKREPSPPGRKRLGISVADISAVQLRERGVADGRGVLVASVMRNDKLVKTGDVVRKVGDKAVASSWEAIQQIRAAQTNPKVSITVWRQEQEVTVELGWEE